MVDQPNQTPSSPPPRANNPGLPAIPPTAPTPPEPPSKPRRLLIIISIVGIILVLIVISIVVVLVLNQRAGNQTTTPDSNLPSAGTTIDPNTGLPIEPDQTGATPTAPPTDSDTTGPTIINAPPPFSQGPANNLLVIVRYTKADTFSLTIDSVSRTADASTIAALAPFNDGPFSLIRLLDVNNAIIAEEKFTIATEVHVEDFEGFEGDPFQLDESIEDIVIELTPGQVPTRVQLLSPAGGIYSEQTFDFSQLPTDAGESASQNILNFFKIPEAQAQERKYVIAVVNEVGAQAYLDRAVQEAATMVQSLYPWTEYQDQIEVVKIANTKSLRCKTILLLNKSFVGCPNTGHINRVVRRHGVTANVIVIVTNQDCNCGTVYGRGNVTGMGRRLSWPVIGHELGHATGKMADEYRYKYSASRSGPNCFSSQQQCEVATADFPDAACSLGCNSTATWRPATHIMHGTWSPPEHGPYEACLMEKRIRQALSLNANQCSSSDDSNDDDDDRRQGNFFGGGR